MKPIRLLPLVLLLCFLSRPGLSQTVSVVSTAPDQGATGVALATTVSFTFSRPVDPFVVWYALAAIPHVGIDVGEFDVSSDGLTISFPVTHNSEADYSWALMETETFDSDSEPVTLEPFILRYTTAATAGPHSVSGRAVLVDGAAAGKALPAPPASGLNLPIISQRMPSIGEWPLLQDGAKQLSEKFVRNLAKHMPAAAQSADDVRGSVVFLYVGHPFYDTDAVAVAVGLVTDSSGNYVIPGLRSGIYWPIAYKFAADGETSNIPEGYIGFYDPDGDGVSDPIEIDGGDVTGIDIDLASFASYMRTDGELESAAWTQAEQLAQDQLLYAIEGLSLDEMGRSLAWVYYFYSPSQNRETRVLVSLLETDLQFEDFSGEFEPRALPAERITSDEAMQVALANGGAEFRADYEELLTFATVGPSHMSYGEGPETDDPIWSVAFLGFANLSVDILVVYVDLATGAFFGAERSAPAAALHMQLEEVTAIAAGYGDDFRLTSMQAFNVGIDGTSKTWFFDLYSASADAQLLLSSSAFSGLETTLLEDVGGHDGRFLPDDFLDTDVVMMGALQAGGAAFLAEHDMTFVAVEGTFTGDRFAEVEDQAAFTVSFTAFPETGMTVLNVVMDMETGAVIHTSVEGDPTSAEGPAGLPENVELLAGYPNPFNPETTIPFRLRIGADVSLSIYDATGRWVAILIDQILPAGEHSVRWNADRLPSGVYFSRLSSGGHTQTRPLLLVK